MQEASRLKQFFQSNKPMLLTLGNHNSSKSNLLSLTTSLVSPDQMILRIKGKSTLTPSHLVELFQKHWAVDIVKKSSQPLNAQFDDILDCLRQHHQSCLLIIDQAHLLPIAVLASLCHLGHQQENQPIAIRVILAGHPELSSKVNALYLKKFAQPPVIMLKDPEINQSRQTKNRAPSRLQAGWQRHRVKSVALVSLFACGFFWWKLQSTNLLYPHHLEAKLHQHEQNSHA